MTCVDIGVVACGALAVHIEGIARRRGWDVEVHPLPPALHNRPERIAPAGGRRLDELAARYRRVAVAYADCGSRGELARELAGRRVEMLARPATATTSSPRTRWGRSWPSSRAPTC